MRTSPAVVSFDITYRCNLSCLMCHAWPQGRVITQAQELTCDEIVKVAKRLCEDYGVKVFRFLGGEPLIRQDLAQIVAGVSPFAATLITTNGVALTDSTSRALISAGLTGVSLSVDGPRDNCDTLRGENVYDRAVAGLQTLLRVKRELGSAIEVKIGNVVSKLNLHHMEEAASFAHELGVDWHFWPMTHLFEHAKATNWNGQPCGFAHPDPDRAHQYVLNATELRVFWKEYYRLARRFGKFGSGKMKQGWLGPLKQVLLHDALAPFVFRDCRRVGQHMIVGPSGEITPCESLRAISFGNVTKHDQEIWAVPSRVELEDAARKRSLPVCRECQRLALYRRHM